MSRPIACTLLLTLAVVGCGPGGPITARLRTDVRRPSHSVLLFLCDGVGADVVEAGCREGWLPNIQKRLVAPGSSVRNAVTTLPPITYAAIATFLTGVNPATHGVVGDAWFDPEAALFRDYLTIGHYRDVDRDYDVPTIYALIAPAVAVSIDASHAKGVTYDIPNVALVGARWFLGDYVGVDKLSATSLGEVARWANARGAWPELVTCYFPSPDALGHLYGPSSDRYRAAVINMDHQVGRVCDWLEAQDLLATTNLVLVSDHGMVDVRPDGTVDLADILRRGTGRRVTATGPQDGPIAWRRGYFDKFDVVVAAQSGRCAFIYLRGAGGWATGASPAEVEAILSVTDPALRLWELAAVDFVAYLADDETAVIRAGGGIARVSRRARGDSTAYAYRPDPDDLLGYFADAKVKAFVQAGYHGADEWFLATCTQEIPDFVPEIIPLLHTRRAGQVIVFAKPGYSFVTERGGHGDIRSSEMRVPMLMAGPDVPRTAHVDCGRAVDLTPTLLELLQRTGANGLEGASLLPPAH